MSGTTFQAEVKESVCLWDTSTNRSTSDDPHLTCSLDVSATVAALQGSCVFIPCAFDINQQYEHYFNDSERECGIKKETLLEASGKSCFNLRKPISHMELISQSEHHRTAAISLPKRVEALQGSCVFICCTFDINQQYEYLLTDSAKRMWFKDGTAKVFNSSSPNTGLLKGEIFGTAAQKKCSIRFDNVSQSHNGSYYFRIEANGLLKYSYKAPTFSQVQISVLGSPPKPTVSIFKDQKKLMEVIEGSSVSLRCSTKIFCPFHPPNLKWSSSLNENITDRQYQSQTELISDLNFTVSRRHHGVTFTCTATHQLQQQITTQESRTLRVQYEILVFDSSRPNAGQVKIEISGTATQKNYTTQQRADDSQCFFRRVEALQRSCVFIPCTSESINNMNITSLMMQREHGLKKENLTLYVKASLGFSVSLIFNTSLVNVNDGNTGDVPPHGISDTSISLPQTVEALQGSCVFIPCTFDIDQQYEYLLTDSAKRMWFKDGTVKVFNSSSPNTGLLKGEIFGTATQKNCSTRFDNVSQSHNGSYYFRIEANSALKYSYIAPTFSQVQIAVLGSPPKPIVSVFKDLQEVMEGSSVSLRCSTKIFCPFHSPNLTWSSSLNENITERQYQNQTELISDLNFTVSHRHHGVTFTCTATHQLQQQITTQQSHMLRVQEAKVKSAAFEHYIPRRRKRPSALAPVPVPAAGPSWQQDQKASKAARAPPPRSRGAGQRPRSRQRQDLRGRYYCTAENKHGTQNTSVLLDVQGRYYCTAQNKHGTQNTSVLLDVHISLPQAVEALQGSCVFIPCTFDINQQYEYLLTDSAKRMWFKDGTVKVFNSSSPNTGLLKGEIFGTATQKNCSTRFDNVSQSHNGSYYFRIEGNSALKYSYIAPTFSQVQIAVLGSPPKPIVSVFKDLQEVMEGSSVSLRCSTKIFCPFHSPNLTWSSSLNENITERQYQNQTELISDLNFTVSHRHHGVTFTCTATHQLQQQITTQQSHTLRVQYWTRPDHQQDQSDTQWMILLFSSEQTRHTEHISALTGRVFCGFSINLPEIVEALQGSCVFIPCTFDIDQEYEKDLTNRAKRIWFKEGKPHNMVFDSSRPNSGLFKGQIFGTATQKNCSTRFDNVSQSHDGSYFFRLESRGQLHNKKPGYPHVEIAVIESPPKPTVSVFKDQHEVTEEMELMEGSSVSLRCSTKIFCPFHPPNLTWSSYLNESVTERQYQSKTELISDLNFTVSHYHHGVTFKCTTTHQLQQQITTHEFRMLRVQSAQICCINMSRTTQNRHVGCESRLRVSVRPHEPRASREETRVLERPPSALKHHHLYGRMNETR
ncbi:Sialoadhesin [Labeo rohita]|uniref:Sialoadhesin n=1 Tax=Labeo rohita TaxID=84645 RepID=A0ABQ8MUS1_LABRO|nr:Sialoadhesin [Labeo rohita]